MSVVGEMYVKITVDRVGKVTGGLIDDEQGGSRTGRVCVDQIIILQQLGEKLREKSLECMSVL